MTITGSAVRRTADPGTYAAELARSDQHLIALFGGLDPAWRAVLDRALVGRPDLDRWVADLLADLDEWAESPAVMARGTFPDGVSRPFTLGSDPAFIPLGCFITNLAALAALHADGLPEADVLIGHSAGLLAAWVAGCGDPAIPTVDGTRCAARAALLIGAASITHPWSADRTALRAAAAGQADAQVPMAVVDGLRTPALRALIPHGSEAVVADCASPTRHVVSGPARDLAELRHRLSATAAEQAKQQSAGALGGAPMRPTWQPLALPLPFHHPALADLVDQVCAGLDAPFPNDPRRPVIDPAAGGHVPSADPLRHIAKAMLTLTLDTCAALRDTAGANDTVVLVSPLAQMATSARSALAGSGVVVLDPAEPSDRESLFTPGRTPAIPLDYRTFAPAAVRDHHGKLRLENRHTRLANRSPVILPGMTPTTVDAPIVAAAANAGHVAELAGGGQVSERILTERLVELSELLNPGSEVVFNTLYLDPYLWGLHIGRDALVLKARAAGAPLCGLTVSAGIPEPDEGAELLDRLHAAGMWLNAFKPGTVAQVTAALRIAARTPHPIWLHLEGGAAGGHHSWEGLDELLLATYAQIRELDNVILAVGGGIADPRRAADLLTGTWARRYGEPDMPVDAVLLGTLAMAAREAATSASVKAALVSADGHDSWVLRDEARGGCTSGLSQLDADIHYLDNSAAATANLLQRLGGDAELINAHRDEIIEALGRTAKPYFGDPAEMTYEELLRRFIALTALGRDGRYEDGAWLDPSHRSRFQALLQRAEARLAPADSGTIPTLFAESGSLDVPAEALEQLLAAHPAASTALLHPADVDYFLEVARRPGKPLPFVPVIGPDVRRWYLSDALWQAHDDRYDADQVLVIPGPTAVTGITQVDEPVADLLDRFEAGVGATIAGTSGDLATASPTRLGGAVEAALRAPTWRWLGQPRPNPLWRVADPDSWEVELILCDGSPTQEASWSGGAESASLTERGSGGHGTDVDLTMCWPGLDGQPQSITLELHVREEHGSALVEVAESSLAAAGTVLLPNVGGTTDAAAHAATVAAVGPLPDRAMAQLWPSIFAALADHGLAWASLDLVHLSHSIRPADAPVVDQVAEAVAEAPQVFRTPTGLVVQIESACGSASVTDRFFVRHSKPDLTLPEPPAADGPQGVATPPLTLGSLAVAAPVRLDHFALITGDHNPIHRSDTLARFAGLPGRIVHGMWTSAAATRAVIELAADGDAARLRSWSIDFVGTVRPGQEVRFTVRRVAMLDGARVLTVQATTEEGAVAVGQAVVGPPPTIYVFPGQGIQSRGMGMPGYQRSAAAREVWDEADRITRERLGFSILEVVRDNPSAIEAVGETYRHPAGVLHLTQFTQVAMATLAQAQVAELREAGAFDPTAALAGHSVGEYNALAALTEVLPLPAVIQLVFARGRGMHSLVPRDAEGRSDYRLGVIRPHLAGLNHEQAEAVVSQVASDTGQLCQIVNHNLRGKQYAVAGTTGALAELARRLGRESAGKDPLLYVPGIDVPFHSAALIGGVAEFRTHLQEQLPARIDADGLIGRYLPNLYPRLFRLDRDYVAAVRDTCGSPVLTAVLDDWERSAADRDGLARTLLIELLAWQFASPVRWIESFELMCAPRQDGGLGIERVIEVGLGDSPTLANLGKAALMLGSHTGSRPQVLNLELDALTVFEQDTDPAPQTPEESEPEPSAEAGDASAPQPQPQAAAAAPTQADRPVDTATALRALLALRTNVRPDQLTGAAIEELVDGASSRRNQVLMDLGSEFGLPAMDGAHELPLAELEAGLAVQAKHYRYPGPVLGPAVEAAVTTALGRLGAGPQAITRRVSGHWGLGEGWSSRAGLALALATREGSSRRGGDLTQVSGASAAEMIDAAVQFAAAEVGVSIAPVATVTGTTVDAAAVQELRAEFRDLLAEQADGLLERLRGPQSAQPDEADAALAERLAAYHAEHGPLAGVAGTFDPRRHVHLASSATWALADVDHLVQGALAGRDVSRLIDSIAVHRDHEPRIAAALRYHRDRLGDDPAGAVLRECLERTPTGIGIPGVEVLPVAEPVRAAAEQLAGSPGQFAGQVALVTGASPNSIAEATVAHLLRGGATVVLTTSSDTRERIDHYRRLERECAGPGAELHVIRANLASFGDIDKLVDWLIAPAVDTSRVKPRQTKPGMWPTLVLPFAAAPTVGMVPDAGSDTALTLRLMAVGVQRLIGSLAERAGGRPAFTVVLPLSDNIGIFGGDGGYAEAKAALLTLEHRWHSEADRWGRRTRLIGADIGWVRGTGLMAGNDTLARRAERELGITTFSAAQMGGLIAALATPQLADRAESGPLTEDLSGGLRQLQDPYRVREVLSAALETAADGCVTEAAGPATIAALPNLPDVLLPVRRPARAVADLPAPAVRADEMIVIAGIAEYGPWGASETRRQAEHGGLTAAGVVELAWRTGLIEAEDGVWRDTATGSVVDEADIAERYRDDVAQRVGIRHLTKTSHLAADGYVELTELHLDRPLAKTVASRELALSLAGEAGAVVEVAEGWRVTLPAGAAIRVPQRRPLPRSVGGQFPRGGDPTRHGLEPTAAEGMDPMAGWNLVTTAEALLDAGVTPEELLAAVHPSLIGNTQGAGMGGLTSLTDFVLGPSTGDAHANDILQEALPNVIPAHTNQELIGGYGPMVHPIAACASAAVSLEEAVDKILLGKAEVMIAGGWDDLTTEDIIGFADMSATADNAAMFAAGLEPDQHSRPGDRRRGGFVESHGGGTMIVCRGSVARALGLPVRAVVAYAGSFGDGYHSSIPAPGLGALGAGRGGADSALAQGLARLGLTVDDVTVVSKHDTATLANDPNEAYIHASLARALGRSPGAGLRVVSQKALTGHAKGGAAAWQLAGLCDIFDTGLVPGNANLVSPDPAVAPDPLVVDHRPLQRAEPVLAALTTSLGFGHVSALVALAHPAVFEQAIAPGQRDEYAVRARRRRLNGARQRLNATYGGDPVLRRRTRDRRDRSFEAAMLLDPQARPVERTS